MRTSLEFLFGLLEMMYPASIAWEDFEGPHGPALRHWQHMGFIGQEPGMNPVPSCPHCGEGVASLLGDRFLCNHCFSTVDLRYLQLWPLNLEAFLTWLASQLQLQGGVQSLDGQLWQLGSRTFSATRYEVLYRRGALTQAEKERQAVFKNSLVLYGLTRPPEGDRATTALSLLDVLTGETALTVADVSSLLGTRGNVAFDATSGVLWVGQTRLGEVPIGSREHAFLECLGEQLDTFVPYDDIKRYVLQRTGNTDGAEEATFCQKLKSRIKKKWIQQIDWLIVTNNKADGYRLRKLVEP